MVEKRKDLYLFDFDGTLTRVDTLFDFLKHSFPGKYKSAYFKFIFLFILVKLKLRDPGQVKQKFLVFFLEGKSKTEIEELAFKYFQKRKKPIPHSFPYQDRTVCLTSY